MTNLIEMGAIAGIALLALLTIGIVFSRLYKRSTKETAFVRTGLGGQKVIMDGGAIVEQAPAEAFFANPQHERTQAFLQNML